MKKILNCLSGKQPGQLRSAFGSIESPALEGGRDLRLLSCTGKSPQPGTSGCPLLPQCVE